jgi:hypothetical protein
MQEGFWKVLLPWWDFCSVFRFLFLFGFPSNFFFLQFEVYKFWVSVGFGVVFLKRFSIFPPRNFEAGWVLQLFCYFGCLFIDLIPLPWIIFSGSTCNQSLDQFSAGILWRGGGRRVPHSFCSIFLWWELCCSHISFEVIGAILLYFGSLI